jgi:hypothetical protein
MTDTQERRHVRVEPRGLVSKNATLIIDLRQPVMDCEIIEMSAGGACVFVHGQDEVPNNLTLLHAGTKKVCRVIWRRGRRIGLQYITRRSVY